MNYRAIGFRLLLARRFITPYFQTVFILYGIFHRTRIVFGYPSREFAVALIPQYFQLRLKRLI